jgi:hypothetical protein
MLFDCWGGLMTKRIVTRDGEFHLMSLRGNRDHLVSQGLTSKAPVMPRFHRLRKAVFVDLP